VRKSQKVVTAHDDLKLFLPYSGYPSIITLAQHAGSITKSPRIRADISCRTAESNGTQALSFRF